MKSFVICSSACLLLFGMAPDRRYTARQNQPEQWSTVKSRLSRSIPG
jgi:hypothetical protein